MKKLYIFAAFLVFANIAKAQLNVGALAAPDASAALQVTSTTGGFRPPQVSLTSTTSFGLAAWTVASAANGMLVYNSNASITGAAAYPAYGIGIYQWDGTGWINPSRASIIFCSGNGVVSANYINNVVSGQLDLGTEYIQTADVTVTGNNKIIFNTAGTYKFDGAVIGNLTANNTTNTATLNFSIIKNSSGSINDEFFYSIAPVQAGTNTTIGANYLLQASYIVTCAAGDYIYIKGNGYGIGGNSFNLQIQSLQITRIK